MAPYTDPVAGPLRAVLLNTMGKAHNIATTTLWELRKQGRGPRVFKIGKKLYVTPEDWADWIGQLAASGGPKGLHVDPEFREDEAIADTDTANARAAARERTRARRRTA